MSIVSYRSDRLVPTIHMRFFFCETIRIIVSVLLLKSGL